LQASHHTLATATNDAALAISGAVAPKSDALSLAAFIASSRDPVLKEFHPKLSNQQRGFKAIISAVARKR
jgi:transposase